MDSREENVAGEEGNAAGMSMGNVLLLLNDAKKEIVETRRRSEELNKQLEEKMEEMSKGIVQQSTVRHQQQDYGEKRHQQK